MMRLLAICCSVGIILGLQGCTKGYHISEAQELLQVIKKNKGCPKKPGTCRMLHGDLRGLNLKGFNFKGAFFQNTDFQEADLKGANFKGATLRKVIFIGANLEGANLQNISTFTNYRPYCVVVNDGADFRHANLQKVNFQGADLSCSNLKGVDLRGVNLRGAKLYKTNLRNTQIDSSQRALAIAQGALVDEKSEPGSSKPSSQSLRKKQPSKSLTLSLDEAKSQCTDLGFKKGTESFGECVLKLSK